MDYTPEFRDEDFFQSTIFENTVIYQYAIDVMKELQTHKENLVVNYNGHELYMFNTPNWHMMFYQHDNNGCVYFEKVAEHNSTPFHYAVEQLQNAAKNNEKIDDLRASYDFSFASINYDIHKVYCSKRQLEMAMFSAKHIDNDKKQVKIIEAAMKNVDTYNYHIGSTQDIINSMHVFDTLELKARAPSLSDIAKVGVKYAQCFDPDYQTMVVDYLAKTKRACIKNSINQDGESFSYNDSDNSVYYHSKQKALVFNDQNMGFIAFEAGKNSWNIVNFSSMYGAIEDESYFFNNEAKLEDITVQIKDGVFVQAGANMYSLHYNVFGALIALKESYPATRKKKNIF